MAAHNLLSLMKGIVQFCLDLSIWYMYMNSRKSQMERVTRLHDNRQLAIKPGTQNADQNADQDAVQLP